MAQSQFVDSGRLLETLERLLAIPTGDLENALDYACNAVGDALNADKVDAFLYDESRDCLVALGTSSTPLSSLERKLGLDVLQVSNGGRVVQVYQTGKTFITGNLQNDPEELRGVKEGLQIQSKLGVPLEIGGRRKGMMMIASQKPDFFGPADVEFAESVARRVGIVAHRAELVKEVTKNAVEQARRGIAEELVTVLAHDLRNYMTPINARMHLIRRRADRDGREEDRRDTTLVLNGIGRLNQLVSDILDVARLDRGIFDIDIQPIDITAVARDLAKAMSTPDHEIIVDVVDEAIVGADRMRIQQCLENVVANAVQHSPDAAPVKVGIRTERREEKMCGVVDIHNEGPGIPIELMPRVFQRFVSGQGSRGLGLGLYLAKRIAVAHGGDLIVESPLGKGTRFILRVPTYDE